MSTACLQSGQKWSAPLMFKAYGAGIGLSAGLQTLGFMPSSILHIHYAASVCQACGALQYAQSSACLQQSRWRTVAG